MSRGHQRMSLRRWHLHAVLIICMLPGICTAQAVADRCPPVEKGSLGICVEECSTDADCEAEGKTGQICCSNGCGHVCTMPLQTSSEAKTTKSKPKRPTTLMAVLAKDANEGDIMASVPEPSSKNMLKAVNILMLDYNPDKALDGCKAFETLSGRADVSSVEWDGSDPECPAPLA
eukprot:TRINITY_DN5963_c1_g1_i1.p1 TRINITY_DN5963_c1_g1~~TRINITY_DN5963_c1_g1_i1.p1  ORF type:complete len:192 (-),score=30.99 TRINITY_DN5963_c1_g1_i1:137-661(-)